MESDQPLSFIIFGATGDLARKKLFPALAALQQDNLLPQKVQVIGAGRREQDLPSFLAKQCVNVQGTEQEKLAFFAMCRYAKVSGEDTVDWAGLRHQLEEFEGGGHGNRVFFLSVPPSAFGSTCEMIKQHAESTTGYSHVVIEKPFGTSLSLPLHSFFEARAVDSVSPALWTAQVTIPRLSQN